MDPFPPITHTTGGLAMSTRPGDYLIEMTAAVKALRLTLSRSDEPVFEIAEFAMPCGWSRLVTACVQLGQPGGGEPIPTESGRMASGYCVMEWEVHPRLWDGKAAIRIAVRCF